MCRKAWWIVVCLCGLTVSSGTAAAGERGKPAAWTGVGPVAAEAPAQFDAQINGMVNNNLMFLSLQTKVESFSQTTQMISNIAKSDSDAKLNAVRNLRN